MVKSPAAQGLAGAAARSPAQHARQAVSHCLDPPGTKPFDPRQAPVVCGFFKLLKRPDVQLVRHPLRETLADPRHFGEDAGG